MIVIYNVFYILLHSKIVEYEHLWILFLYIIHIKVFMFWDGIQKALHSQVVFAHYCTDLLDKQSNLCFLTIYTSIIHQNDFLQQYCRWRIEHTVDSSKQRGPRFIMKNYYDTGGRQGRAALKFLFNTSRRSQSKRTIITFITLSHSYTIAKESIIFIIKIWEQSFFLGEIILTLYKCK